MTEFNIQNKLFDKFLTLDEFATENGYTGEPYFATVEVPVRDNETVEEITNVHLPNVPFEIPESKRWFDVTFRNNDPIDASLMEGSQYRFTGVMYIDIYTPQDVGEGEAEAVYSWIAKLFNNADMDYVDIMKVYISTKGNDADCYRLQVAIEWEADIDKE